MEITFIENGIKRKGILVECKLCGKQFASRKDQIRLFCSPECFHSDKRKRVKVKCAFCQNEFEKKPSQLKFSKCKSGLYFCTRACKDQAQRIGGIEEIMPPHYGQSDGKHLINQLLNEKDVSCIGCGEFKRFLLCVHHIDGDHNNNVKENLEVVCGNCHIIRHLKNNNGIWVYHTKSLTPRNLITEIYNTGA
jgi:HNH endonuclease.